MASAWILLYHAVHEHGGDVWTVAPADLEETVRLAREAGLEITTLAAALDGTRDAVAITFDDAHRSVHELALPMLDGLGVTATVFASVDWIRDEPSSSETMTWSQLRELDRHGWSIASHGCAHVQLDRLTAAEIERELRRSKQVLEDRIGGVVSSFAYPYGAVPPASVVAIEQQMIEAGYGYAVLAAGGAARTPPRQAYRVPRDPMAPGQRPAFAVKQEGAATWRAS